MLAATEEMCFALNLQGSSWRKAANQQVNGLIRSAGQRQMLQAKNYSSMDLDLLLSMYFWTGVLECQGDQCWQLNKNGTQIYCKRRMCVRKTPLGFKPSLPLLNSENKPCGRNYSGELYQTSQHWNFHFEVPRYRSYRLGSPQIGKLSALNDSLFEH